MEHKLEIDLKRLFKVLLKRAWIIVLCAVLVGASTLVYTKNFVQPKYTASVTMYINNNNGGSGPVSSSNLAVALQLVNTYVSIIQSDRVLEKVVDKAGVILTPGQIRGMLTVSAIEETEMFKVKISCANPQMAADIANTIAEVAPDEISDIIEGSYAKIVDDAVVPKAPSSPNVGSNTILGALIGGVAAAAVIILMTLLDVRIKSEEDLANICSVPVLGRIPDMSLIAKKADKKVRR